MWKAAALALAGFRDAAQWEVIELRVASPELTLGQLERAFPFKDPRMLERVKGGLRQAQLPE